MASKAAPIAWKGVQEAIKPLQADLFVLRGRTRSKRNPSDWEFHANPLALGIAAVGAGLTLWLLQLNVRKYATEVIESKWLEFDVNAADYKGSVEAYVPEGWTLDKTVAIGHKAVETNAGNALAYLGAGLLGPVLQGAVLDAVDVDIPLPRIAEVTPKIVSTPEQGHYIEIDMGPNRPVARQWVIDIPAETHTVGYHIRLKAYNTKTITKTMWHIDERKGLSIGTLV